MHRWVLRRDGPYLCGHCAEPASAADVVPLRHRWCRPGRSPCGVLTGGSPLFAPSDVGLPVTFVPAIPALLGCPGPLPNPPAPTTIAGGNATNIAAGPKKFVIGLATKTAPATGDSGGTLAITLVVSPNVSPTSPPCAAKKTSSFQIPLSWRNPQGTAVAPLHNTIPAAGYNTYVGGTQLSGVSPAPYSIAQLDFRTASTSFSGYVQQTYTVAGNVQSPSSYAVNYTFLPVGVGVCPGTGTATTWNFFGLSKKIVENPSFTGGGGGGRRGLKTEQQNTSDPFPTPVAPGAQVTTGHLGTSRPTATSARCAARPRSGVGCLPSRQHDEHVTQAVT